MNIGARIQALRKARGLSQEELAAQIGVSRQAVSKWEAEQSQPDMDKVIALSRFFGVTTDYLLIGEDAETTYCPPLTAEPQSPYQLRQSSRSFLIATMIDVIILIAGVLGAVLSAYLEHRLVSLCCMVACFMGYVLVMILISMAAGEISEQEGAQAAKAFQFRFWCWNIWLIMVPVSIYSALVTNIFSPNWWLAVLFYFVVSIPVCLYCLIKE